MTTTACSRGPSHRRLPNAAVPAAGARGASLIIVMMILVIVSILGVGAAQIALMGERSSRNDRDLQIAFQSAETALFDATNDIEGAGAATRGAIFNTSSSASSVIFVDDCGTTGNNKGLCAIAPASGKPAWLEVDFTATNSPSVAFGDFTGAAFDAGTTGVKPAAKPRYVIEPVPFYEIGQNLSSPPAVAYRVTAMGFGPRADIQGVVQMIYRKE